MSGPHLPPRLGSGGERSPGELLAVRFSRINSSKDSPPPNGSSEIRLITAAFLLLWATTAVFAQTSNLDQAKSVYLEFKQKQSDSSIGSDRMAAVMTPLLTGAAIEVSTRNLGELEFGTPKELVMLFRIGDTVLEIQSAEGTRMAIKY